MLRGVLHRLTILLLVAALPAAAVAQDQGLRDRDPELDASKRIADELQRAVLHYGPFYLLSSIQLSDIGYEREDQFWVPTRNQTSGLTIGINAPQRLYFVPRRKVIFALDVVPGYSLFQERTGGDDDEENPDEEESGDSELGTQFGYGTRASMQLLLNHLYLDVYAGRSDAMRANTGEINSLVTVREELYGVGGEYKHSSRTSLFFAAGRRDSEYPRDRFQPADRPVALLGRGETNTRASFVHKTFGRVSLLGAIEANTYDFHNLSTRDSRRRYAGAGLTGDFSRRQFRVEVGQARLDFKRGGKDFSGLVGNATFNAELGRRVTVTTGLVRDVDFSIFGQNTYYVLDRSVSTVNYRLYRNWNLRSSAHIGRDRYDVPVAGGGRRVDELRFLSGGVIYATSQARAGLEVGYFQRDTNTGGDRQDGIRFIIHLSFTPK